MNNESMGENVGFWDQWALHGYDDNSNNEDYQALSRKIAEDVGQVDQALDVATGTGLVAFELAKRGVMVEGIDIAPEMINVAQQKARDTGTTIVRFSVMSAYQLEYGNQTFDALVIAGALHAMKTPGRALDEAKRVLKPDGVLVVPTPCHGEDEGTLAQIQKIMESGFIDYQLFSGDSHTELVRSRGFNVITREKMEWVFPETGFRMVWGYIVARPA